MPTATSLSTSGASDVMLYVIRSTVPPPASHTVKQSPSRSVLARRLRSAYSAAPSGSVISRSSGPSPAATAAASVVARALSLHTAGTVSTYSTGVSPSTPRRVSVVSVCARSAVR